MPTSSTSSSAPPASPSGDRLDLTGEVCPYTFVRTRFALEDLPLGATLRVYVDHEPARRNVPRSATEWGQEVVSITADGAGWLIEIVKRVP